MKAIVLCAVAAGSTGAFDSARQPAPDAIVYVTGDNMPPSSADYAARATASWIFARIGVRLEWHDGNPPYAAGGPVAIRIRFVAHADPTMKSAALAYAQPFGGVNQIEVIYDRIRTIAGKSSREAPILAHVLAHEIGHILQQTDAHAETGIMKARWTHDDFEAMDKMPQTFTPGDVSLLKAGLKARRAA